MALIKRLALTLMLAMAAASPVSAVEPDEMLADPAAEERARDLSTEIRCLVCQNQSIDESNAPLAEDMRVLIRERIRSGDSNAEIKDYLTARYGDFVLLKPPMKPETYALWFGPAVVVALGGLGVAVYFRRRRRMRPAASRGLSEAEESRLRELMNEGDETA
jgi:cytochrome c-type biogenesis protein CcmH